MTADPFDYTWSNNALNAFARDDPLIHPHFAYMALASTDEERHNAYRAIAMENCPKIISTPSAMTFGTKPGSE